MKVLNRLENLVLKGIRLENHYPPLFIVGPPRSGTTLVYQYILNTFHFGYFPNISKSHPRACVSVAAFHSIGNRKLPISYVSRHGIMDGVMAPSDGWDIFGRWFPNSDFSQSIREETLHELRTIVRLFEIIFEAPFTNKNNANSVRIHHLNRLFPNAIFVHVEREPVDTVISIIEARRVLGLKSEEWWAVPPPQFRDQRFSSVVDMTIHQVLGLNEWIQQCFRDLPDDQAIKIEYDQFCRNPNALAAQLERSFAASNVTLTRFLGGEVEAFETRSRSHPDRRHIEDRVASIEGLSKDD